MTAQNQGAGAASPPLLTTGRHDCPYLAERMARTQFLDPREPLTGAVYEVLIRRGFRRSGAYLYRPTCPLCNACRSLRIPAADFHFRRRHRRCLRRNGELHVAAREPRLSDEQHELYRRYLQNRHAGSDMVEGIATVNEFLTADWCDTVFYEVRAEPAGDLLAVAVTDILPNALSAVYTFYDPRHADRGLGTLAVLWQLGEARRLRRHHLYLGYWIAEAETMAYKEGFRPHEVFDGTEWVRVE